MVTEKEIEGKKLDVQLAEANLEAESMKGMSADQKLELAKTNLERERLKVVDGKQKLGEKTMDNMLEVWKDVNKENNNSGNGNNNAVESNR